MLSWCFFWAEGLVRARKYTLSMILQNAPSEKASYTYLIVVVCHQTPKLSEIYPPNLRLLGLGSFFLILTKYVTSSKWLCVLKTQQGLAQFGIVATPIGDT